MRHVLKVGLRYVTATPGQSALLIVGVAVGVFVFIFMSALIGGLAVYLVRQTLDDIARRGQGPSWTRDRLRARSRGPS
ncbi:MAG: hypothetical protein IPL47_14320 [Phyllobacteriaceae bacterium]|nr:hypothetical protein [Phyllobacteriaceae bacterium]